MLSRLRHASVVVVGVAALVSLSGCADRTSTAGGTEQPTPETLPSGAPLGPTIDWTAPYGDDAPTFSTATDAASELPFKPQEPSWGKPSSIQTIPPDTLANQSNEQVAFVYDLPDDGKVLVEESLQGDYSIDVFAQMVADHPAGPSDSAPPFQLVSVRGTKGLLVEGDGIGRVMWIEDGLLFDILGESVTPDQVLKLAEGI